MTDPPRPTDVCRFGSGRPYEGCCGKTKAPWRPPLREVAREVSAIWAALGSLEERCGVRDSPPQCLGFES